ncbi:hypothetical protein GCM10007858_01070 [Bradyrhizobium liaoningense]|nr:hypothetical protein GCM10007858_01070 [Bradyrhizobium liaoningense]
MDFSCFGYHPDLESRLTFQEKWVLGFGLASPLTLSIALIWLAHIGIDRALGYGLKYSAGFSFTHLGRIGRQKAA